MRAGTSTSRPDPQQPLSMLPIDRRRREGQVDGCAWSLATGRCCSDQHSTTHQPLVEREFVLQVVVMNLSILREQTEVSWSWTLA